MRALRYLAPNLITLASLLFGMGSIAASVRGNWEMAAWFVLFSVLTDKLDGFVARLVKGTSEFGVQLDSFADFLNFGIAPATLFYTYLSQPGSPIASGREHALLMVAVGLWVLAVTFRLARYNIVGDDPRCKRIFFGVPTTLAGGLLAALFLTFLKYGAGLGPAGDQPMPTAQPMYDEPRMLGGLKVDEWAWRLWPLFTALGAFLMASTIKIPKLGLSKSKALTVFIFTNVALGYAAGALRRFPEYLAILALIWIVTSMVWGQFNHDAKTLRAPPLFPKADPPAGQEPMRPEEDAVPDEPEPS